MFSIYHCRLGLRHPRRHVSWQIADCPCSTCRSTMSGPKEIDMKDEDYNWHISWQMSTIFCYFPGNIPRLHLGAPHTLRMGVTLFRFFLCKAHFIRKKSVHIIKHIWKFLWRWLNWVTDFSCFLCNSFPHSLDSDWLLTLKFTFLIQKFTRLQYSCFLGILIIVNLSSLHKCTQLH